MRPALRPWANGSFDGIGLCLRGSGFVAFDIDKCRDKVTGELNRKARKLLERCEHLCRDHPVRYRHPYHRSWGQHCQSPEEVSGRRWRSRRNLSLHETGRYITVSGVAFRP